MELTNIKDIFREKEKYADAEVTVGGWVRSNRDSKTFGFLVVNDGSFFEPLQVVYSDALSDFDEIARIGVGAAVTVRGKIVVTPGAKQPLEMQAIEVVLEGASPSDYPLQKRRHSFEYLGLEHRLKYRIIFGQTVNNNSPNALGAQITNNFLFRLAL